MSSPISFGQVAQLVKKLEQVGWDAKQISKLGQATSKQFRAIETILDRDSKQSGKETTHLRFLETTTIAPTKGSVTLFSNSVFDLSSWTKTFENQETEVATVNTAETALDIYEINKEGTFYTLFSSFGVDLRSLCITQSQIVEFVLTNPHLLLQKRRATLFLFQVNEEVFVFSSEEVEETAYGRLEFNVDALYLDHVWDGHRQNCLVVPQQTV